MGDATEREKNNINGPCDAASIAVTLTAQQRSALAAAGCEVAFDNLTRQLYATDASIYQIEPVGVAFPRSAQEASRVIQAAAEAGVPVIPRGAGTGLVGGAIGDGLVVDFARHNRQISQLNLEQRTVRVGPGVVLDQLNALLKPHSLCFGPDVATSSRATLGGMIANNSSGAHVPVYGTTADHLASLEIVLADGRVERVDATRDSLRPQRESIAASVQQHAARITEKMPPGLLKRWPGYALDRFLREPTQLNHLFCGSEGTLAAIVSAELKIVPVPPQKGLGLIFFTTVAEAMQATVALLDLKPAAIEHIDHVLLDQTQGQLQFRAARDLLELDAKPCESILLVEFYEHVADRLEALSRRGLGLRTLLLKNPGEMNLVWALRKASLSLLTGRPGDAKPITGIEDTAVRPEQLPAYVAALESIMRPLGLETCYYGHAASGLLHVRPVLDLHQAGQVALFRQVAGQVSAVVCQFKGSLAGEHGVGIARTEFLRDHLGDELLGVMREIKAAFDPKNLFNPGKILDDGRYRIDRDLRLRAGHGLKLPFEPILAFAAKDGSFVRNLEQCNGCGGCRKDAPTMCPTFIATGDEIMSTRGRANVIRAALELRGLDGGDPLRSIELEAALSNCLSCKACTTECPSNVNLALLKAELLYARHRRDGLPLRERLLSSVDLLGRLGCLAPTLANACLKRAWFRRILARVLGFTSHRPLPRYAGERFDRWFARHPPRKQPPRGSVILWDDTFVRYHEPHIGIAAVAVLEAAGFEVVLAQGRKCCGRPAFSQGNLAEAARLGLHNLSLLEAMTRSMDASTRSAPVEMGSARVSRAVAGVSPGTSLRPGDPPILFLEPSCYSMFAEDYRELKLAGAERVAGRCFLFEQFVDDLLRREPEAIRFQPRPGNVVIHAHCHARSLSNPAWLPRLAQRLPGRSVTLLDTGCCGMAGAFGMLESKYELSLKVAEPLVEKIREQPPGTIVVASGTSCRHQIEHVTGTQPKHMAELLAEAIA
ncbi:MAG: FAD-binding and (Fe-S)-binding domain-containing protein [Limisphaerales bacterium]